MQLSKEQLSMLKQLDEGKLPVSNSYFNKNLKGMWKSGLLEPELKYEGGGETVIGYHLTEDGKNLVSIEREERQQHIKDNFWLPLAVGIITALIGFAAGWISRGLV